MSASDCDHPSNASSTLHGHFSDYSLCHLPVSKLRSSASHSDLYLESASYNGHRYAYPGRGTPADPYVVSWAPGDPEDPYNWSRARKWAITAQLALCTWTVSFGSSSYAGGIQGTARELRISEDVALLGISLYVLGFALGPLVFAPMGEMFGRRIVFLVTLSAYTLLQLGGSMGHNLSSLLTCRLLTGIFGSSPLTNAGGAVSDIWNARERGLATAIYSAVPFLGPVIGPIVGGFVAENPRLGWHFNFWLIFLFAGVSLLLGYFIAPETYAPVLLRRRAQKLALASNGMLRFVSVHDVNQIRSFSRTMRLNLSRPFLFIVTEPIVLLIALYISVMYGTLYALFAAFPIVFEHHRGFSSGEMGLAFLGIGFGIVLGLATQKFQDALYFAEMDRSTRGVAPPEARLHTAIIGGGLIPIGLFWFAWSTPPSVHWIVPVIAGVPFGAGVAMILQSLTTYLMDTYPLYFASSVASTIVLRSCFAAAFPLFSPRMFAALGDAWAMSLFGFIALGCMPIPILFWRYGSWIRSQSRVAFKDCEEDAPPCATMGPMDLKPKPNSNSARPKPTELQPSCSPEKGSGGDDTATMRGPVALAKIRC